MKLDKDHWDNKALQHRCLVDSTGIRALALFDRALAKHGQVFLMVRDMPTDDKNLSI